MVRSDALLVTTAAAVLWTVSLANCATKTEGPALTVVSVSASSTTASAGGATATGSGGQGGQTASSSAGGSGGGATTTTGAGGSGGAPEEPVAGCLTTTAQDLTNQSMLMLVNPLTGPYCVKVSVGTEIVIDGAGAKGTPMIVGGIVDMGVKLYDNMSPIQPSCYDCNAFPSCFDPNSASCYNASTWKFTIASVYPFYDNSSAEVNFGVIYVVE